MAYGTTIVSTKFGAYVSANLTAIFTSLEPANQVAILSSHQSAKFAADDKAFWLTDFTAFHEPIWAAVKSAVGFSFVSTVHKSECCSDMSTKLTPVTLSI